ncbi:putative DNA helicase [Helianthus annuus]|nr:putative DNA helicase [Helianthus annuus]
MIECIHASTPNYGKVKLLLKKNRYLVESPFPEARPHVSKRLLSYEVISRARIFNEGGVGFNVNSAIGEIEGTHDELLNEAQLAAAAEEKEAHSFEIDPSQVYFYVSLTLVLWPILQQ